ncbi:PRD domain-containing protein [Paenibacillus peoriae]|uniref:PRD domain-containing protein n=1 Tax=Paenibacillus peoriae TaxID=59893 RepID=UPI00026C6154|nr:PRD domain-containing protein [Paenibacillus peoriae]MEC0184820.1 PRD domain-containing protein [Paenibacillus peoriae]
MKINRVLNNNAVVVKEGNNETIIMGGGIAFQKGKNDLIDQSKIEKVFVLKEESQKFQELLSTVPESHIAISEDIISYAEKRLGMKLSNHVHISLTDHLSFAIERSQQNIKVRNKLINEIRILYNEEFKIGLWALQYVKEQLGITFPEDEAAFIALHIHTAKVDNNRIENSIKIAFILQDVSERMLEDLGVSVDKNSISYHRLLKHLEYAISRFQEQKPFHSLDQEMIKVIKKNYKKGFQAARKAAKYLDEHYQILFPESETAYIALHLQRILENI